jgi:signal peptidase I
MRYLAGEALQTLILLAMLVTLVNLSCGRFVVEGTSMAPNFETGQFILVSRVHYLLEAPQRGDIIVFQYQGNPEDDYIKRVIGLPGETVELRGQQVYIDGVRLNEPYLNEPCTPRACPDRIWELGADEFFVMGDNRNHSTDSRAFGPIQRRYIIGEAVLRYYPLEAVGSVARIRVDE